MRRLSKRYIFPALLVGIFGVSYLRTVSPTIWFGDTAEFQTIAYLGGLGHTTGYPLYLSLAKLFVFFPAGNPALNLNIMSTVFGILTVLAVYHLVSQVYANRPAGFGAALIFGCGATFWSQTALAEVYTLHSLIFTAVLILLTKWDKSRRDGYLMGALFLIVLSLANHLTMVLIGPALIYMIISSGYKKFRRSPIRSLAILLFPVGAGFLVVVILYYLNDVTASPYDHLRAIEMMSPESWGKTPADFDSFWERMIHLLTGQQFSGALFGIDWKTLGERLSKTVAIMGANSGWPGLIAALVGFIIMLFTRRRLAFFLAILAASILLYNLNYGIWEFDIENFFIPLWIIAAVLVGGTLDRIGHLFEGRQVLGMPEAVAVMAIILVIILPILYGSPQVDALADGHPPGIVDPYQAYNSTRPVVDKIEDGAIIFALWHQFHVMGYIMLVEQGRTDIAIHELYPAGESYKFSPSYLDYIEANIDSRPIYLTYPARGLDTLYHFEPQPPLIRLRRR